MKKILLNPFKRYRAHKLLAAGFMATLIGSILAWLFNTRFDGVIDIHSVTQISFFQPLVDNLINIALPFLFLLLIAKYLNAKSRLIDILAVCVAARIPLYVLPLFNINNMMLRAGNRLMEDIQHSGAINHPYAIIITLLVGFIEILFVVWYLTLLFKGFKVASHAQGTLPIVLFIAAILLAEVLSKYLIYVI